MGILPRPLTSVKSRCPPGRHDGRVTGQDQPATRRVTLVVCNRDGEVLGQLEPFRAETPWWQDVEPLQRRHPWLTTLRLLEVHPDPGRVMGGELTYLAELTGPVPSGVRFGPSPFVLNDDPRRMPWACPGGPAADLEWADLVSGVTGTPIQHRAWNLSSIWEIPIREGRAWLKCVPPFFAHEADVIRQLGTINHETVSEVLASAGHRMLLRELPGRDGFRASLEEKRSIIDTLVEIQASTIGKEADLLAAGVPDNRWPSLARRLRGVVGRKAPADPRLAALLEGLDTRAAEIDRCGLPPVLCHGDAHAGNARLGAVRPVWFDWGDSTVGHPLLDLAVLEPARPDEAEMLESHWLRAWAAAVPSSDPRRAWELLRPLALLRQAAVYQEFLDNIEQSEQIFHREDVAAALVAAAEAAEVAEAPRSEDAAARPVRSTGADTP